MYDNSPADEVCFRGRKSCRILWFRGVSRGQRSHRFWEQRKYKKRVARVGIQPPLEINFESPFLLEESGFRCMVLYMSAGICVRLESNDLGVKDRPWWSHTRANCNLGVSSSTPRHEQRNTKGIYLNSLGSWNDPDQLASRHFSSFFRIDCASLRAALSPRRQFQGRSDRTVITGILCTHNVNFIGAHCINSSNRTGKTPNIPHLPDPPFDTFHGEIGLKRYRMDREAVSWPSYV